MEVKKTMEVKKAMEVNKIKNQVLHLEVFLVTLELN